MFRRLARLALVLFAMAAVVGATTGTASASPTVNWRVDSTPPGQCSGYQQASVGLKMQACIITNNGYAQAVLVAKNDGAGTRAISGRIVFESARGGDAWCASSYLSQGYTVICMGPTVYVGVNRFTTDAKVWLNGYADVKTKVVA